MKDKEEGTRNRRDEPLDCHTGVAPVRGEENERLG